MMSHRTKLFLLKHAFDFFIIFFVILNLAPIMAPVFAHVGLNGPAKIIYFIYSFFCHQFHWRSLHIFDHQCAWCTRDTFIWGAILLVAIIVKLYKVKALKWYWIIPFVIPIALDGVIQTIATIVGYDSDEPYYMSTNATRMFTGATFGAGLSMWMMPTLKEIFDEEKDNFVNTQCKSENNECNCKK
jgi:uncharacterized membrane protein